MLGPNDTVTTMVSWKQGSENIACGIFLFSRCWRHWWVFDAVLAPTGVNGGPKIDHFLKKKKKKKEVQETGLKNMFLFLLTFATKMEGLIW